MVRALSQLHRNHHIGSSRKPGIMASTNLAVIVLAAGLGTRMRSARPKVLHTVAGRPLIAHVAATAAALRPARIVLVVGPGMQEVVDAATAAAPKTRIVPVVQRNRRGTGHAVKQTGKALQGFRGDVLILLGD